MQVIAVAVVPRNTHHPSEAQEDEGIEEERTCSWEGEKVRGEGGEVERTGADGKRGSGVDSRARVGRQRCAATSMGVYNVNIVWTKYVICGSVSVCWHVYMCVFAKSMERLLVHLTSVCAYIYICICIYIYMCVHTNI